MKLNVDQIRDITRGAVRVTEEEDGIHFYRFTEAQEALYRNVRTEFYSKTHATAGIRVEFKTNSKELEIKTNITSGSSRKYFSLDVFVNGELNGYLDNFSHTELPEDYHTAVYETGRFSKTFSLGEGEKEVCIYFSWSAKTVIEEIILDDNSYVKPTKPKKKLLVYGDSITQGYDALRPSHRYPARIADAFNMEEINKAIGGEIHCPELAKERDDFNPDCIMVAYGTNDWSKCSKETVKQNCEGFYKALCGHYPDTPILTIAPIWRKDFCDFREFGLFREMEELIREIVKPYKNINVISGYDFVPKDENYFSDKYLHPNDLGFEHYFRNLYNAIAKCDLDYTGEKLAEERKNQIRNTKDDIKVKGQAYFVSADGDDNQDGKTPESAWKTLEKASNAQLDPGDGVFLRRGDTFRGQIVAQSGVTYAAYGEGNKPNIYGWDKNLAAAECWELVDDKHHIWKCTDKVLDAGTIVFNEGEYHSRKLIPSYIGGQFVCRDCPEKPFVMEEEMEQNLDVFFSFTDEMTTKESKGESFPIPKAGEKYYGDLYLRCDEGNPGECFSSIELLPHRHLIKVLNCKEVYIDNLCLKYGGGHAVAAGGDIEGLHVTNCEIGWIGGCIQHYYGTDPNYPEGTRGTVTRYGNGVEIYGACDNYEVSDCYIYQIYDAGMTHQVTVHDQVLEMKNVLYKDNLVEYCVYAIEYFLEKEIENESSMSNIEICGNILRYSGYGWGQQRHNKHTPAHIKGWSYVNTARNFKIHHNVFEHSAYRMLHLVAREKESLPQLYENTYIQKLGEMLGQYGGNLVKEPEIVSYNENVGEIIRQQWGDLGAKIYQVL